MVPSRKTLVGTATACIEGYNTWTVEAILASRAKNCTHQVRPGSLGEVPPFNNEQYGAHVMAFKKAMSTCRFDVKELLVDEAERKVIAWFDGYGTLKGAEQRVGEYIFIMRMDAQGEKVISITEFVDSKASVDIMAAVQTG